MYDGCLAADRIIIDGLVIDALSRTDLDLWYCDNKQFFWSASWLAALFSTLGKHHELKQIVFQISEPGIDSASLLRNEVIFPGTGNVVQYAERRRLISLYEKEGNLGTWSFAFLDADAPAQTGDFRIALGYARAAVEIGLDAIAQGFGSRK